jgi:hypothetical protein
LRAWVWLSRHRRALRLGGHAAGERGRGSVVLRAADGTTYNLDALYTGLPGIPPPIPAKIGRGANTLRRVAIPVRWRGPLELTPECLGKELPVLQVRVGSPGPPADQSAAIAEVVAASGTCSTTACRRLPAFR